MANEEKAKPGDTDELSPEELDQISGGLIMPPAIAPTTTVVKSPILQTPALQTQLSTLIKPSLK